MFRKIDQILKKSPFYRMIAVVSLVAIGESFLNLFNHRFLFSNMQTTYTFLFLYGAMLLLSKLYLPKWLLFILVYLIFLLLLALKCFLIIVMLTTLPLLLLVESLCWLQQL